MAETYQVSLLLEECDRLIYDAVVEGSVTGECIDRYQRSIPGGGSCVVVVYEKHYYRAGNRLTLTVTLDDFQGHTQVHCVGGGGGEGLFHFDWGAAESFSNVVREAVEPYLI